MKSFEELLVYRRSIDFVVDIYNLVGQLSKNETYGLSDQLKRASVSIPSNISEGFDRRTSREFLQFLRMAFASSSKVWTQLTIVAKVGYISDEQHDEIKSNLEEIRRMLAKLIVSIKQKCVLTDH
jgi:four helix bundle protein